MCALVRPPAAAAVIPDDIAKAKTTQCPGTDIDRSRSWPSRRCQRPLGVAYLPCDIALELDANCAAIRVEHSAQGGANWPVYVDDKLQRIR